MEREGFAFALSAGGTLRGADWAASLERGEQEERQHPTGENNPASDRWMADVWTVGGALVRPISVSEGLLALWARYTTLSGHGARGDLPDTTTFVSDERVFHGEAEVRLEVRESLSLLGKAILRHEARSRYDQLAQVGSDLRSWSAGFGIGAVYRPWSSLAFSATVSVNAYGAGGAMPDPREMGPVYGLYVAPELALEASDAFGRAASLGVLWSAFKGGAVAASLGYSAASPQDQVVSLESLPEGRRACWLVRFGIVVGERDSGL
jgi:hypothetical protein